MKIGFNKNKKDRNNTEDEKSVKNKKGLSKGEDELWEEVDAVKKDIKDTFNIVVRDILPF